MVDCRAETELGTLQGPPSPGAGWQVTEGSSRAQAAVSLTQVRPAPRVLAPVRPHLPSAPHTQSTRCEPGLTCARTPVLLSAGLHPGCRGPHFSQGCSVSSPWRGHPAQALRSGPPPTCLHCPSRAPTRRTVQADSSCLHSHFAPGVSFGRAGCVSLFLLCPGTESSACCAAVPHRLFSESLQQHLLEYTA